jgi:hypothetical protein
MILLVDESPTGQSNQILDRDIEKEILEALNESPSICQEDVPQM